MRITNVLLGVVLAVAVVGLVGCKKESPSSEAPPPMIIEGVKVELPKLVNSIVASGSREMQNTARNVQMSLRYGQYEKAMTDLDKLVDGGNLGDEQKKLATEVLEQLKQVISKAGGVRKQ